MVAPAKTPKPIIDRLSQELVAIIHSQDVREKMLKIYFKQSARHQRVYPA